MGNPCPKGGCLLLQGIARGGDAVSIYESARVGRAFSKVRKFWNPDQILSSIMPPMIGLALLPLIKAFGWGLQDVANLKLAGLALVCGIFACLASWLLSFVFNYVWVSPAELHREQKGEIDRLTGAMNAATKAAQLQPDFRLEVHASATDTVRMNIPGGTYTFGIPIVFLTVTNKGQAHFEVVKYRLQPLGKSPRTFDTDLIVSPGVPQRVPIQLHLIDVISEGVLPEHGDICAKHHVLVS